MLLFWFYCQNKCLNFGHGNLQKVMEKVMESHGILKSSKSTNPVIVEWPISINDNVSLFPKKTRVGLTQPGNTFLVLSRNILHRLESECDI